jgi:dipeptidyl-peptidase 4
MKKLILSGMISMSFLVAFNQEKELSLEDAILKSYSEFYPKSPSQLGWIPNSDRYAFVSKNDDPVLMSVSVEESDSLELISLNELNDLLNLKTPLKSFPRFEWINESELFIYTSNQGFVVNLSNKKATLQFTIPEEAEHIKFNPQFTAAAYVQSDNLYIIREGGKPVQLTSDGGKGIVYGQAVHRSEFGITDGLFWSPKGDKLAFYRMDESMVEAYPLVDISVVPAHLNSIRYPMAGRTSHHVKVGVFDLKGSPIVYMNTEGSLDQYLVSVGWTPQAKSIVIGILNRDQNHLKLNLYDAKSGYLKNPILEEKSDKYVEPEHAPWFLPGSDDEFLWYSERSGFQHLYLYKTSGELVRQITRGLWEAHDVLGFDPTMNYLFVSGTGETVIGGKYADETYNGLQSYTYMIDFELGGHQLIDSTIGSHSAMISSNSNYLMDRFSSIAIPQSINLFKSNSQLIRNIHTAKNPLAEYKIGTAEIIKLPSEDGKTLYARLIKPSHFDPSKKYPVLVYVYGGPHAQLIQDQYLAGASLWMYWFAEQGYIVATIDNRGSANRGLEFEQVTYRNLGIAELADQKNLVDYLKSQVYVDPSRMAVHGWSYGGFMTINMLLTFPGTFQAGIAGGPVCDWSLYEVMYTERYMDTPESNPAGYKLANLVERSNALDDDLLVIHGTEDNVVVWQHSQSLVKSCVDNGKQLDYFIYPGHEHNVRGKDRVHLITKVLNYTTDRIGPGTVE